MTITVAYPISGGPLGPGYEVSASSNFIGPLDPGSFWRLRLMGNDELNPIWVTHDYPSQSLTIGATLGIQGNQIQGVVDPFLTIGQGHPGRLLLELHSSVGVVDSFTQPIVMDAAGGIPTLLRYMQQGQAQGGFQQSDRQVASDTQTGVQSVLSGIQTTMQTITGPILQTLGEFFSGRTFQIGPRESLTRGVVCTDTTVSLGIDVWYGIELELTTIPDFYAFTGPGTSWCASDLAVIEILRGGDLIYRTGCHSIVTTVSPLPGLPTVQYFVNIPITPPQYDVRISFGTGVCGELFALPLP